MLGVQLVPLWHARKLRLKEFITNKWKGWSLNSHSTTNSDFPFPSCCTSTPRAGEEDISACRVWGLELHQDYAGVPGEEHEWGGGEANLKAL